VYLDEGDMVTVKLLNSDKSVAQQIAMFTIQGGGALLTQLNPDVKLNASLMSTKGLGYFAPFMLYAGASGLRTVPLALVFDPSSKALNGCFQLAVEIKRASGAGTTTVVIDNIIVKRMERPNDRGVSIGTGLMTGAVGWFPTGRVCDFICWPCRVDTPPSSQSLSGYVYCDSNNNGVKDAGEALSGVGISLSGTQNKTAVTNGDGFYQFDVLPGIYKLTETQPGSPVTGDGKAFVGSCSGTAGVNMISDISVAANAHCVNYNFSEQCNVVPTKCDTICWRPTQYFITYIRNLPGGTVLIYGVNANNPVGNQSSNNAVRQALYGGQSVTQRFNKEYVTGQLSISSAGGSGSPVTFNTFWSPLSCSGIAFAPVTLSNGVTLSPSSLLDTLVTQSNLAIRENRTQDMGALASIWALLNGRCG
ncbi:MAG: SdrD B-like domain-containing protein, partial [Acidobacteriota bacterium]